MPCFNIPGDAALSADGRSFLFLSGRERTQQRVAKGLEMIRGTYKYNRAKGIPWPEILNKEQPLAADVEVRRFLLAQPEIAQVKRVTLRRDKATRTLFVQFEAVDIDGEDVSGEIPIGVTS